MEAKVQKQIIDYFAFFEEFYISSKTCLKDCQNCAVVINKLICRCKKIQRANVSGTPLEEFAGLQSKLTTTIHNLISEEIGQVRKNLSTLEDLFDKLCYKNKVLQESSLQIDFENDSALVNGTPYQPSLKKLLEFVADTITFSSEVCALIEQSLEVLTYKELNTDSLVENFKISTDWQRRISEILSYTSFCSENII